MIKVNGDAAQTVRRRRLRRRIWRVDDGRVVLEPFEPFLAAARREIGRGRASGSVPRRALVALGEQLLHARDLDPLAVLDVMRRHASDRTQHRHNVHPLACPVCGNVA